MTARAEGGTPPEPPRRLVRAQEADETGREWLTALPGLTGQALRRWGLTPERVPMPGGRRSLLVLVRRPAGDGGGGNTRDNGGADGSEGDGHGDTGADGNGDRAALKLVAPGADAAAQRAALERWDGWGAVRLLAAETAPGAAGALLLERLHGEVSLRSLPEDRALLEAAGTLRRLWTDPGEGHPFPSVTERTAGPAARLRAAAGDPAAADVRPLVSQALAVRAELTAAEPEQVLLHGRFREDKVVSGDRAPWLAVGPDPLVGERAYDLAQPARTRLEDLVATAGGAAVTRRRLGRLADSVEVDPERLRGWTLFRAVADGVPALLRGDARRAEPLLEFASWL
ncbi:aminoglycoside phosphotransferase family protein [Streptomyces zingiberis]|uniref:Kinase n=1 Tax=Streptomyces zingiberis TaxID=2053010 RepID=A0ABX1C2V1_9ACTN|nr:aminoglycoside phosphotransferase family protein [Streptomyces zingiberis]NJQ02242.1 kinase [Streptomyces zingiberis]